MESLEKRAEPSRHLPDTGLSCKQKAAEQGPLRLVEATTAAERLAQNYMITSKEQRPLPTNMKAMRAANGKPERNMKA